MYFSDDLSGLGYMFAYLFLGSLPWEKCKSEDDILNQKEECVLDGLLKGFPVLLSFIRAFRTATTDKIDYAKWIKEFTAAAERIDPSINPQFLPKSQQQSMKPAQPAQPANHAKHEKPAKNEQPEQPEEPEQPTKPEKPTKPTKREQPVQPSKSAQPAKPAKRVKPVQPVEHDHHVQATSPEIVDLTEEPSGKKRKVQDTIDQSPLSFKQTTQRRQEKAKEVVVRRPTRIQPPRSCKK